jgi:hypothetical protein
MRLAPIPYLDPSDREKLRPKAGDTVLYEGVKYVVEQIGLKYVTMALLSDPRIKGFVKLNQVAKYFEPAPDNEPPLTNLIGGGRANP